MKKDEVVIVLHGLGRSPYSMFMVSRALKRDGYDVADWGYLSVRGGMQDQIGRLCKRFGQLTGYKKVHGVGHSLGGLMLRGMFGSNHDLPLGRFVMMGTPNQGASMINRHGWLFNRGPFNRPIIRDLKAGSPVYGKLPIPNMDIGIIAGIESFNPFNPVSWINRSTFGDVPHDGTVETSSAKIDGMKDYLEVKANHSFLSINRTAIKATVNFINTGKFT